MKRGALLLLALGLVAGIAWYRYSPGMTVDRLRSAVQQGDARRLDRLIDFEEVRQNLKRDLRAALREGFRDDPHPLAELGSMLTDGFVAGLVDTFVTPSGMATLLRTRTATGEEYADRLAYEIERDGPFAFDAIFGDPDQPDELRPALEFRLRGLAWRVVRIRVPDLSRLGLTGS